MCKERQQFAHCVQSIRAKYFWLKALTTPSILSGACCFSHDRNSQFSSSRSRESCWILDRSVSIAGTATRFFRLIPASRSKAAQHLSNIIRFVRRRRNYPQQRDQRAGGASLKPEDEFGCRPLVVFKGAGFDFSFPRHFGSGFPP